MRAGYGNSALPTQVISVVVAPGPAMLNWDDEADIVCVGGGLAALAAAIAAVEAGADALLTVPGPVTPAGLPAAVAEATFPWFGDGITDPDTLEYFAAVAEDLGPVGPATELAVPVRAVEKPRPFDPRQRVEPFIGSRLPDWAANCLQSPYGLMHTRVADWQMTSIHTPQGEAIEVKTIGLLEPQFEVSGRSLADWLVARAHDLDIEAYPQRRLHRLVFDEGEVVGAVLTTPDGHRAVRARHGVTVTRAGPVADITTRLDVRQRQQDLQVGLVSQTASRFCRLEIVTTVP